MSELEVAVSIIEAESRDAIEKAGPLKEKVKAAFNVARDHWIFTDEEMQYRAALGAVLINIDGEDKEMLIKEIKAITTINALLNDVPVDLARLEIPEDTIGLMKLWKEQ